jgi:catechol-2,3-dioxygenase
MPTLGLNHCNLRAPPALLEQLRAFYCDVVGLSPGFRPPFGRNGYWLYAGQQPVVHLTEAAPEEPAPVAAVTSFNHMAFSCSGRQDFEGRLAALGIRYRLVRLAEVNQVQLFCKDPAGNGVELNFAGEDG